MFRKIRKYWYNLTHPIIGEVWELHRVTPNRSQDERYAPFDITPERLESLINTYQRRGYVFVSIDEICNRIHTITTWCQAIRTSKCIAITLDDGYQDNYDVAYPIFKKYNVPFCIYVATGYIDAKFIAREDSPSILTKEQLIELNNDPLCTLGSHTVTHPNLAQLTIKEQEDEIEGGIRAMEQITGHKITNMAIPYGVKNEGTMKILKSIGLSSQVNAWGGPVRMGMNSLQIPRYIVEENRITQ